MADVPSEPVDPKAPAERPATVAALDVTGSTTMVAGTVVWLIAFLVMLPFYGRLHDHGDAWWMWTALAGVGLGLFGIGYCYRRERRLTNSGR